MEKGSRSLTSSLVTGAAAGVVIGMGIFLPAYFFSTHLRGRSAGTIAGVAIACILLGEMVVFLASAVCCESKPSPKIQEREDDSKSPFVENSTYQKGDIKPVENSAYRF